MDASPYVEHHRRKMEERRQRREAARREALEDLAAMAPVFASTPGLARVYLLGALAQDRFREDSDIDRAVEGLDAAEYLRRVRDARAGRGVTWT
jgi:predicted nucleotidyltransferase